MITKKYELLTDDTIMFRCKKLYRIKYLKDIPRHYIRLGDLGGYIESERNLSHYGDCAVLDYSIVKDKALVTEYALVKDRVISEDNAIIRMDAIVSGNVEIAEDALIQETSDYTTISPIGSEDGILTAYKNKFGGISCTYYCFNGTLEEFEEFVNKRYGNSNYGKEYKLSIELIKIRLGDTQ